MSHGTFCFMAFKGYGWYLSSTAALLYCSWFIHNIVAWMKIKPFIVDQGSLFRPKVGKWTRYIYMGTLFCTIPPIILQIYDNFRFFNNISDFYTNVRPYEPLFRDPWWVFTCLVLFHVVQKCYGTGVLELIRRSPRFGILLAAIILSLTFTALDIASSIHDFLGTTDGINPWWKLSLVFKCLTDTIMLDDFKTELKRLGIKRIRKEEKHRNSFALVIEDKDTDENGELEFADALNVSPERFAEDRRGAKSKNGQPQSPRGRLRNDSAVAGDTTSDDHRGEARTNVGRSGGRRISRLPGLGNIAAGGWKPFGGKRSWGKQQWDVERDPPDVQRFEPQQDPLTRSRTWDTTPDQYRPRTDDDDSIDDVPLYGRSARMERLSRGSGEGSSGSDRRRETPRNNAAALAPPAGALGSPDIDSIDFQTRPAGL